MSELRRHIADSVQRLFGDLASSKALDDFDRDGPSAALWKACTDAGFDRALAAEARGGAGASLADVFPLCHGLGFHALGTPLADSLMAHWLLSEAGIDAPDGALALLEPDQLRRDPQGRLSGVAHRVAWAGFAHWGVTVLDDGVVAQALLVRLDGAACVKPRRNRAAEPVAELQFDGAPVAAAGVLGWPQAARAVHHVGALARSAQMIGALERVLQLSVDYASERAQFGKPIAKYQAVQQQLAAMAGQLSSARTATLVAFARPTPWAFDTAVAKLRASEAAGIGAATAHQVHGAIGYTREHRLHFFTRRLWSWRNEFGTDARWAAELGRAAIGAGASGFWPALVSHFQPT
jgi:acyl-CoA dehydrogenase